MFSQISNLPSSSLLRTTVLEHGLICFTQLWSWISQLILSCMNTVSILRTTKVFIVLLLHSSSKGPAQCRWNKIFWADAQEPLLKPNWLSLGSYTIFFPEISPLEVETLFPALEHLRISYSQFHILSLCWGALKIQKELKLSFGALSVLLYSLELYAQWPKVDII